MDKQKNEPSPTSWEEARRRVLARHPTAKVMRGRMTQLWFCCIFPDGKTPHDIGQGPDEPSAWLSAHSKMEGGKTPKHAASLPDGVEDEKVGAFDPDRVPHQQHAFQGPYWVLESHYEKLLALYRQALAAQPAQTDLQKIQASYSTGGQTAKPGGILLNAAPSGGSGGEREAALSEAADEVLRDCHMNGGLVLGNTQTRLRAALALASLAQPDAKEQGNG